LRVVTPFSYTLQSLSSFPRLRHALELLSRIGEPGHRYNDAHLVAELLSATFGAGVRDHTIDSLMKSAISIPRTAIGCSRELRTLMSVVAPLR